MMAKRKDGPGGGFAHFGPGTDATLDGREVVVKPGALFRARVTLYAKGGAVLASAGETCDSVNPGSLGWLAEQGYIEPIDEAAAPATAEEA